MRRLSSVVGILALMLTAAVAAGPATLAQGAAPDSLEGHPLVGSWLLDANADDPSNLPSRVIFSSDGTFLEVDEDGLGVGSWESTGPSSGALTILFTQPPDANGAITTVKVRAAIEVSDDGQSLSASYTLDFIGPDGTSSGEFGPATATATRIAVEPMGTPVGPIAPPPSPAASPAA